MSPERFVKGESERTAVNMRLFVPCYYLWSCSWHLGV
jgi:hypothetical protein